VFDLLLFITDTRYTRGMAHLNNFMREFVILRTTRNAIILLPLQVTPEEPIQLQRAPS